MKFLPPCSVLTFTGTVLGPSPTELIAVTHKRYVTDGVRLRNDVKRLLPSTTFVFQSVQTHVIVKQ